MLAYIDNFLLDKIFEPLAQWLYETVGISCFRIAKQFFILSLMSVSVLLLLIILKFGVVAVLIAAIVLSRTILHTINFIRIAGQKERELESGKSEGVINCLRYQLKEMRCWTLVIVIFFIPINVIIMIKNPGDRMMFVLFVLVVADFISYYMISCTLRTPREIFGFVGA